MYMKHLPINVGIDHCVAYNLLTVKSERSRYYTQVLREFCVPKNSFGILPIAVKHILKA